MEIRLFRGWDQADIFLKYPTRDAQVEAVRVLGDVQTRETSYGGAPTTTIYQCLLPSNDTWTGRYQLPEPMTATFSLPIAVVA